jgi:hypothetical protein
MDDTDARAAFITAALVLLVMPRMYIMGLAALFLVVSVSPWSFTRGLMVIVAVVWGLIVIVSLLMVARRLTRRSARV